MIFSTANYGILLGVLQSFNKNNNHRPKISTAKGKK